MPSDAFYILSMFHEHRDRLKITIRMHYARKKKREKGISITGERGEQKPTLPYPNRLIPTTTRQQRPRCRIRHTLTLRFVPLQRTHTFPFPLGSKIPHTTTLVFHLTAIADVRPIPMRTALPMGMGMGVRFLPRTLPLPDPDIRVKRSSCERLPRWRPRYRSHRFRMAGGDVREQCERVCRTRRRR